MSKPIDLKSVYGFTHICLKIETKVKLLPKTKTKQNNGKI